MSDVEPGVNAVAATYGTTHMLTEFTGISRFMAVQIVPVVPVGVIGLPKTTMVMMFARSAAVNAVAEASVNVAPGMTENIATAIVVVATVALDDIVIVYILPPYACFRNCTPCWPVAPINVPAPCDAVVTVIELLLFSTNVPLPTCRLPAWSNMHGLACALVL